MDRLIERFINAACGFPLHRRVRVTDKRLRRNYKMTVRLLFWARRFYALDKAHKVKS